MIAILFYWNDSHLLPHIPLVCVLERIAKKSRGEIAVDGVGSSQHICATVDDILWPGVTKAVSSARDELLL